MSLNIVCVDFIRDQALTLVCVGIRHTDPGIIFSLDLSEIRDQLIDDIALLDISIEDLVLEISILCQEIFADYHHRITIGHPVVCFLDALLLGIRAGKEHCADLCGPEIL